MPVHAVPGGLKPKFLISYTLRHLAQKDKVRFFYALKGRGAKEGIIARLRIEQLGKTVLLVDAAKASELRDFLHYWRCDIRQKEVWTRG
jgi:hypothetical protein